MSRVYPFVALSQDDGDRVLSLKRIADGKWLQVREECDKYFSVELDTAQTVDFVMAVIKEGNVQHEVFQQLKHLIADTE